MKLHPQRTCELHVHVGGCYYVDDLLNLGREVYADVDWSRFCALYEQAYGVLPDPVQLFADALTGDRDARQRFRDHYVYTPDDGPDFHRFAAKFHLFIALSRHLTEIGHQQEVITTALEHHRREQVDYVEYRAMDTRGASDDPDRFLAFHRNNAEALCAASTNGFQTRYIVSLPRWEPLIAYNLVQRLLAESPELVETVVGLDLCHVEEGHPPKSVRSLFKRVAYDNRCNPECALDIVYHVGESFYDKSLESAVRWCHEAAILGAKRLGHCIALGLAPEIAVGRQPGGHEEELVSERIDQIDYDLSHASGLRTFNVEVDACALLEERKYLLQCEPNGIVRHPYDASRLHSIEGRQRFVLAEIARIGAVIEICPTSNLCLGGVPYPEVHPLHNFLLSDVDLVIAADDPGIFDSPLSEEIDWVLQHSGLEKSALAKRLGDPRQFKLGQRRKR